MVDRWLGRALWESASQHRLRLHPQPASFTEIQSCQRVGGCGSSEGKVDRVWTERQRDLICCISLGRLSNFSEPHFGHLHRRDNNGFLEGFNYRLGWLCLNKCSLSFIRPSCLTRKFRLTPLHSTTLCCGSQKCLCGFTPLTAPPPLAHVQSCTFSAVFLSLSLSHAHRNIYTYILAFLFWSTVAHLPQSLYNLVGFATRKVFLELRITLPNRGAVTFLIVYPGTLCSHDHLVIISRLQWKQLTACFTPCL